MKVGRLPLHAAVTAALIATAVALFVSSPSSASAHCNSSSHCKLLLGPVHLSSGYLQLERHSSGGSSSNLPRLRVVSLDRRGFDDSDLEELLGAFDKVLRRKLHFIAIWDVRSISWPRISSRQIRRLRGWLGANAKSWDTYVQAHVPLISNPLARAFGTLVIRVFQPPQPMLIGSSDADADAFARSCCAATKSYVKSNDAYEIGAGRWSLLGG